MPDIIRAQKLRLPVFARDFTTNGSYVLFEGLRAFTTGDPGATVFQWCFCTDYNSVQMCAATQMTNGGFSGGIWVETNGSVSMNDPAGTVSYFVAPAGGLPIGKWVGFGYGGDATGRGVFCNGTAWNIATAWTNSMPAGTIRLIIGYDPVNSTKAWHGSVAYAAMWNVWLSDIEKRALMRGAPPWTIRRDHLRFYWAPVSAKGQEFDAVSGRLGRLVGSAKLAPYPRRAGP